MGIQRNESRMNKINNLDAVMCEGIVGVKVNILNNGLLFVCVPACLPAWKWYCKNRTNQHSRIIDRPTMNNE